MGTLIIAECGVNNRSIEDAFEAINLAKRSGCDAAKFQLYDESVISKSVLHSQLKDIMLDYEGAKSLVRHGSEVGLPVFFSCMFPEAIEWAVSLKVPYIKIRELDWRRDQGRKRNGLIGKALDTSLPLIISSQPWSLPSAVERSRRYRKVMWLLCCPKYPAPLNWFKRSYYQGFYGISNHYPGFGPILYGILRGMKMVEAHFTQSHQRKDLDDNVSFDPIEMSTLVKTIRELEKLNSKGKESNLRRRADK